VSGKTLTFGVSGLLWDRSLVMYDLQTTSHWSHIRGEAMQGEFLGAKLTMLPSQMTTWDDWLAKHPDTTVLSLERTAERFTREFYKDPEKFVYGWTQQRKRYHYPIQTLAADPVQNLSISGEPLLLVYDAPSTNVLLLSRSLNGQTLTLSLAGEGQMRDAETGSTWSMSTGRALSGRLQGQRLSPKLGMLSYLRAWTTFYPNSSTPTLETSPSGDSSN
jgi:uncharacterized protein DUF3179